MKYTSTYSTEKIKPITFADMEDAVKKLKPLPKQKIEVSKKHWKLLKKSLKDSTPNNSPFNSISSIQEIPVFIRPYLKKLRLYTEKT